MEVLHPKLPLATRTFNRSACVLFFCLTCRSWPWTNWAKCWNKPRRSELISASSNGLSRWLFDSSSWWFTSERRKLFGVYAGIYFMLPLNGFTIFLLLGPDPAKTKIYKRTLPHFVSCHRACQKPSARQGAPTPSPAQLGGPIARPTAPSAHGNQWWDKTCTVPLGVRFLIQWQA